jgi:hypothetical protein
MILKTAISFAPKDPEKEKMFCLVDLRRILTNPHHNFNFPTVFSPEQQELLRLDAVELKIWRRHFGAT